MLLTLFQLNLGSAVVEPPSVFELGGGGFVDWHKAPTQGRDRRWKKRKADLEKIDRLLSGIVEQIPDDAPEIVTVRQAQRVVEKAAVELAAPDFNHAALAADLSRAQDALKAAQSVLKSYLAQVEEDDDEDLLLLS